MNPYFIKFKATEWYDKSKKWKKRLPGNREFGVILYVDLNPHLTKLPADLCMKIFQKTAFDWVNETNREDSRFDNIEITSISKL